MLAQGQTYELTVTGYSSEGDGVGRLDGQVVFVRGAMMGEVCRVELTHVGRRSAWARLLEVLSPSAQRVAPDCPYYGRCGGCQTRHMTYPEELRFKAQKVRDALERVGGLTVGDVPIHGAKGPLGVNAYRNKVQFPLAPGPKIGFFAQGSHQVVDVAYCLLQDPATARVRQALLGYMARFHVPAYDESTRSGLIRHLYLRQNAARESLCVLVVNGKSLPHESELAAALQEADPHLRGVLLNVNDRDTNVVLGSTTRAIWGQSALDDQLCGLTFRLSPHAFFQVNRTQTEVLYGLVRDFAGLTGSETVLDLYCGAGTIGLTLAGSAGSVLGVEVVPQAVENARENALANGIQNARFLCADASQAAQQLAREGVRVDVAVVDPPRKGLAPQGIDALLSIAPQKLLYVSCDPATLARDLKALTARYRLQTVHAVDMFPRTHHVETVCLLSKPEDPG